MIRTHGFVIVYKTLFYKVFSFASVCSCCSSFVRCLDTGLDAGKNPCTSRSLDTSPNARFHQCCLVWQHPALPWFELFPRSATRLSSATSSMISSSQNLRDALHREWGESFRSLFQVRKFCLFICLIQCNTSVIFSSTFSNEFTCVGLSLP